MSDALLTFPSQSKLSLSDREASNGHKAIVFWLTGLSGAGKTSLSYALEARLHRMDLKVAVLDGDNIRWGLNKDLGFSNDDRSENIRRVAEVANILKETGFIVITALISPFQLDRNKAKEICGEHSFFEIFVSCPIEICEARDVKGLYMKSRNGTITNFTGHTSPYETPLNPDFIIDTGKFTLDECIETLLSFILPRIAIHEK